MFILNLKKKIYVKKIAIFGSGSGSNAENIYKYFLNSKTINIACIYTNNKNAGIVKRAKQHNIRVNYISKKDLTCFNQLYSSLKQHNIDYIILAGFLLKIPAKMISKYNNKIINIHPSLLPKYGGKGMYGRKVHRSVLDNKEKESGITIHFVNQNYDEGEVILQKKCQVSKTDSIDSLEKKIRSLEFEYFPKVIEKILLK